MGFCKFLMDSLQLVARQAMHNHCKDTIHEVVAIDRRKQATARVHVVGFRRPDSSLRL